MARELLGLVEEAETGDFLLILNGIVAGPIHYFGIKFSFLLIFYAMCRIVKTSTEGF